MMSQDDAARQYEQQKHDETFLRLSPYCPYCTPGTHPRQNWPWLILLTASGLAALLVAGAIIVQYGPVIYDWIKG